MDEDRKQRHAERMKRKKEIVDAAIERATREKGLVLVITGNGKGKSTAAFGMVFRALGHDQRVGVIQFIKGSDFTGEVTLLQRQFPQVPYYGMATGFTWDTQNWDADHQAALEVWERGKAMLQDPACDVVLFDEITYMFQYKYLDLNEVVTAIRNRPPEQSVILTGRAAQPGLLEIADTISIIADERHAFHDGIKARAGIDF